MKILFAGGGTGGPIVPLLAVWQKIKEKHPEAEFLFVGTNGGTEKNLYGEYQVNFVTVPAGKWRRYFSLKNILSPFLVIIGFVKSLWIVSRFKPDVVFGAGGYVCVPVMFAAFCLRKKIVIHQQDIRPSLTNILLAPIAHIITVSFEDSLKSFRSGSGLFEQDSSSKVIYTGNPFRENLLKHFSQVEIENIKQKYSITENIPIILILGGATGALALNKILLEALPELIRFAYVIHSTGRGKQINFEHPHYKTFQYISQIEEAYAIADIVVSRAGLSTITELSALKKVSVIIPMPNSHQLDNALILKRSNAAIVLNQENLDGQSLVSIIKKILYDAEWQKQLKADFGRVMPQNGAEKIAKILIDLCRKNSLIHKEKH